MSFIYRLSLWLLFGFTIWAHGLYAINSQKTPADHYETCFRGSPYTGQKYLAAVKAGNIEEANLVLAGQQSMKKRSKEEELSYAYLKNNFKEIYQWVCLNYCTLSDLYQHLLRYIRNFQLLPNLPTDQDKLGKLEKSAEDYFSSMLLSIAAAPPEWQMLLMKYIKEAVEQQFNTAQKRLASDHRLLQEPASATYSQIFRALRTIKGNILQKIDAQINATTNGKSKSPNNGVSTNLGPNMLLVPLEQVRGILELPVTYITTNPAVVGSSNHPLHLGHFLGANDGEYTARYPKLPSVGVITVGSLAVLGKGYLRKNYFRDFNSSGTSATVPSSTPSVTQKSTSSGKPTPPNNSSSSTTSRKPSPRSFSKKTLILGAVSMGLVAGYQLYSRYLVKGKATATPANPGGMQKKWMFFILFLLLGGVVASGIYYRKKAQA